MQRSEDGILRGATISELPHEGDALYLIISLTDCLGISGSKGPKLFESGKMAPCPVLTLQPLT
jgi:hypothetical protein